MKEIILNDLSVFWNYGTANDYLMNPVQAKVQVQKDKSPSPLIGSEPRFKIDLSIGDVVFQWGNNSVLINKRDRDLKLRMMLELKTLRSFFQIFKIENIIKILLRAHSLFVLGVVF